MGAAIRVASSTAIRTTSTAVKIASRIGGAAGGRVPLGGKVAF